MLYTEAVVTIVFIFDGKAQDVASPEARAVVHASVEQRVGVGVLNVQDLTCGCHVACYTLICWDTKLLLRSHTNTMGRQFCLYLIVTLATVVPILSAFWCQV